MTDYMVPDIETIRQYSEFFIEQYEKAGVAESRNLIMRNLNIYELYQYFKIQMYRYDLECQEYKRALATNLDPYDKKPLSQTGRKTMYRRYGMAKKPRDRFLLMMASLPDFRKFIETLPPLAITDADLPSEYQIFQRTRHSRIRKKLRMFKYFPIE